MDLQTADRSTLTGETTEVRWISVDVIEKLFWKENPKLHDIGKIAHSIQMHGFRDKPTFDMNLENVSGTRGAIVAGNGRTEAVLWMYKQGQDCPRGILKDDADMWYIGVEFGLDAESELAAQAYGIDHNSLTLSGGDLQNFEQWKIYDERQFKDIAKRIYEDGQQMAAFDGNDMDELFVAFEDEGIKEKENLRTLDEAKESFLETDIRRIVIYVPYEDYDQVIERLGYVMEDCELEDHTSAILWMLEQHEKNRNH